MTTFLFPVTDVLMPSADWKMSNLKLNDAFSQETTCFQAKMTHTPTKRSFYVRNGGCGGENMYDGEENQSRSDHEAFLSDWSLFVASCNDALKQSVANQVDWEDLYDNDNYTGEEFDTMQSDCVISLFLSEMENQAMLSRKRGLVVRTPESRKKGSFSIYSKATPEQLTGKVAGEYWDKKAKNWVAL